jgi:hypothetical protein
MRFRRTGINQPIKDQVYGTAIKERLNDTHRLHTSIWLPANLVTGCLAGSFIACFLPQGHANGGKRNEEILGCGLI